jgi:hypothetical protein
MNVSVVEDWARSNNRQPEHYENGSTTSTGENTVDAARRHLAPIIQLLQWLQCFSSLGEDHDSLVGTLVQLQRLTPTQLINAVKNYRAEVGEKTLLKPHMKFLVQLQKGEQSLINRPITPAENLSPSPATTPANQNGPSTDMDKFPSTPQPPSGSVLSSPIQPDTDQPLNRNALTLDQSLMLPFSLPTSTDMLITYGAGIGGVNRERARKYIPTVPTEVLGKLNLDGDELDGRRRQGSIGTIGTTAHGWRGSEF